MSETNEQCMSGSEFLAMADDPPRPVDLPDGGRVYVKSMTVRQRSTIETGDSVGEEFRGRIIAACLCNASGDLLFDGDASKQIDSMPAGVVEPVFAAAFKASGYTRAEVDKLEKNSEETVSDSGS